MIAQRMNNLIGISGKANAGKDLVGQIIQYLTSGYSDITKDFYYSFDEYLRIQNTISYIPNKYEIKKFADKLKDMVCMLLNCTRELLEDRNFKEAELGSEWDKKLEYTDFYSDRPIEKMTPRKLLQLLGTECGRKIIHPNIWVNSLMADYIPYMSGYSDRMTKEDMKELYPKWIITDVRFPNEANIIKSKGGLLIRVNRPCSVCHQVNYHKMDCGNDSRHESETGLDNYKNFDKVIYNGGTIEDLINSIKSFLNERGIR